MTMQHNQSDQGSLRVRGPSDFIVGEIIEVGHGEAGVTQTLKSMLEERLLWTRGVYCPNGVPQRLLPSPLLSDNEGLQIWAAINRLPTYYQTSEEVELFERRGHELAELIVSDSVLIDLGCGSVYSYVTDSLEAKSLTMDPCRDVRKIDPFLDKLEEQQKPVWYFGLDLAKEPLQRALSYLTSKYQYVKCFGLWGTFDDGLAWLNSQNLNKPRFFMSLGSIFGNDHFHDAVARLATWRKVAFPGPNDSMLLTMDATSDFQTIWNSYHDTNGLFERFIRNGYIHSNRILEADWYHEEDWDLLGILQEEPVIHRFVLRAKTHVRCEPLGIDFPVGTEIDCYEAFKYPPEYMARQFAEANFHETGHWKTSKRDICQFSLLTCTATL